MTEEIAATPGWADQRVTDLFAAMPQSPEVIAARDSYLGCLARSKSPAAPSDMLGAEFAPCRPELIRTLAAAGLGDWLDQLDKALEALEAELAADS